MITSSAFAGKTYMVLGLASSGMAAAESLIESGATVMAWDRRVSARDRLTGRAELVDPLSIDLSGLDGVIVTPGVPLNAHPIADAARRAGVPLIGDMELFALARAELPPHSVIGITGTIGKTSVASLATHLLRQAGVPVLMAGNMGLPIMAQKRLPEGGVYVLELSSFQLDLTHSLACDAAGLTNIFPDHLDRHGTFENYVASKSRLFSMQRNGQFAIFGSDYDADRSLWQRECARREEGRAVVLDTHDLAEFQHQWPGLPGSHCLKNAAMAVALVEELGLHRRQCMQSLANYRGATHRMEVVGTFDGVLIVNDSRGNSSTAAACALAAWPAGPGPRIHWICGGVAKAEGLRDCEPYFGNLAAAYTIGESGPDIADRLEPITKVERCEMLCEAIRRALDAAVAGDVILFSPACASFDQFRDFAARGDAFKELVLSMTAESRAA